MLQPNIFLMSSLNGADPTEEGAIYVAKNPDDISYKVCFNGQVHEGKIKRNIINLITSNENQFEELDNNAIESWRKIESHVKSTVSYFPLRIAESFLHVVLENMGIDLFYFSFDDLDDFIFDSLQEESVIRLFLVKFKLFEDLLLGNISVSKLPYLAAHLELLDRYHEKKSNPKKLIITEHEIYQGIIIPKIKSHKKQETHQALEQLESLENYVREIYKNKLQTLRAAKIPNDDELFQQNEIMMLYNVLCMMIYEEDEDHVTDFCHIDKARCPVYQFIDKVNNIIARFKALNDLDIERNKRDRLYYSLKPFKFIDLEKHLPVAIQELWGAVTKVNIKNPQRDEAHARIIVERVARIQYLILKKLQPILHQIHDEHFEELRVAGFDQVKTELSSLRDSFKSYTAEQDQVSFFSNEAALPFYRRVSETLILLNRLQRLKNPDLVTPGDQDAAQEKFKELLDCPGILKKYREELGSILPKIKNECRQEASFKLHRLVTVVQYVASEMRDHLKELKQQAELDKALSTQLQALEYGPGAKATLALTM